MAGSRPTRPRAAPKPCSGEPTTPSTPSKITLRPGLSANTGPIASAMWLVARRLTPEQPKWFVEIILGTASAPLDDDTATRFRLEIYSEEWGYQFCHGGRVSWIRITDVPFVHGRDEHGLLAATPPLKHIATLLRGLEQRYAIRFDREHARIETSIANAAPTIASWLRLL